MLAQNDQQGGSKLSPSHPHWQVSPNYPLILNHTSLPSPRHKPQAMAIPLIKLLNTQALLIPLIIPTTHQTHPPQPLPTPQRLIHSAQQPRPHPLPLILLQHINIRHVRNSNIIRNQPRQTNLLRISSPCTAVSITILPSPETKN